MGIGGRKDNAEEEEAKLRINLVWGSQEASVLLRPVQMTGPLSLALQTLVPPHPSNPFCRKPFLSYCTSQVPATLTQEPRQNHPSRSWPAGASRLQQHLDPLTWDQTGRGKGKSHMGRHPVDVQQGTDDTTCLSSRTQGETGHRSTSALESSSLTLSPVFSE